MRRRLHTTLATFAACFVLAQPAHALDNPWGEGVELIAEEDMAEMRGGFVVADGIEVNFGALVTTFVNGAPALQTQLSWADTGAVVERTIGRVGQEIGALSPSERDALGLGGLENAGGVVISDAAGVTALVHNLTDGALQNIIVNNANGRDLEQRIDVTLELPGFEAIQTNLIIERVGLRLSEDMRGVSYGL